jgi:hypothetical protein
MHSTPNALFLHHGALASRNREETVEAKKAFSRPCVLFSPCNTPPKADWQGRLCPSSGRFRRRNRRATSADWGAMCGTAKRLAVITVDLGNPNPSFNRER